MILCLDEVKKFTIPMNSGDRIYFEGDLGAGKTTLIRAILQDTIGQDILVQSPTYTYYRRYGRIVHFDLYRLADYEEFIAVGGEEILDDPDTICLVEWPDIIADRYPPTVRVRILPIPERDDARDVIVERI